MFKLSFIVIGCRKTATTWLHQNFAAHPDVCLAKHKESNFFNRHFDRGTMWYESLFDSCEQIQIKGEVDPTLITCPVAAKNLAEFDSSVKIIVVFRNPVDLFRSSYIHSFRKGDTTETLEAAWRLDAQLRREVSFATLLEPYLQRFPKEQFLFLIYEDLQHDPQSYLESIYRFIGLRSIINPERLASVINPSRRSRLPLLSRGLARFIRSAKAADLHFLANSVKKIGILRLLERNINPQSEPIMPDRLRQRILREMADEIRHLEKLTAIDVVERWCGDYPAELVDSH